MMLRTEKDIGETRISLLYTGHVKVSKTGKKWPLSAFSKQLENPYSLTSGFYSRYILFRFALYIYIHT